ncbi:hypothetical protein [Bifidobacterium sp. SO1]|uniref:hypothetical protein n=1 Tax=Bifidobacterium sp. SO1 TaxID=2809029 RepID=UPI001BDCD5C9|nr:hypothetical protein [Bifidobacterium sp. SO1]MBT1162869.1 hypothetical protein [Bifidobacterium sp. SO1]
MAESDAPSHLGTIINTNISTILWVNHGTNRKTGQIIGKSEKYVRQRINGTLEWQPVDVEKIARAYGYDPIEIMRPDFTARIPDLIPSNNEPTPEDR